MYTKIETFTQHVRPTDNVKRGMFLCVNSVPSVKLVALTLVNKVFFF